MANIKVVHLKDGKEQETFIKDVVRYNVELGVKTKDREKPEHDNAPDKGKCIIKTKYMNLYENVFKEFIPVLQSKAKRMAVIRKFYPHIVATTVEQYANVYLSNSGLYIAKHGLMKDAGVES